MNQENDNMLFAINVLLIAGLIGAGWWLQQNNASAVPITPAATATATPAAQAAPAGSSANNNAAGVTPAPSAASTAVATPAPTPIPQATITPPSIRRGGDDGGGFGDN